MSGGSGISIGVGRRDPRQFGPVDTTIRRILPAHGRFPGLGGEILEAGRRVQREAEVSKDEARSGWSR